MVEHLPCTQGVKSSSLLSSTYKKKYILIWEAGFGGILMGSMPVYYIYAVDNQYLVSYKLVNL